jgi:hypothetical protein
VDFSSVAAKIVVRDAIGACKPPEELDARPFRKPSIVLILILQIAALRTPIKWHDRNRHSGRAKQENGAPKW